MNSHSNKLICGAMFLSLGFSAMAAEIYNPQAFSNGSLMQALDGVTIGNEISLTPGTFQLTSFSFEYYAPVAPPKNAYVDVAFYLNNGPLVGGYPTPGTKIYDSSSRPISASFIRSPPRVIAHRASSSARAF